MTLGGFALAGARLARSSAGKAYGCLRAAGAVSGKLLAFPLLYSFAVAREQGPQGPTAIESEWDDFQREQDLRRIDR